MPKESCSSESSSSSSYSEEEPLTENEGESTDNDEEVAAHAHIRGCTALVTASCPRKYYRHLEDRQKHHAMIPADFPKDVFLKKFRRCFHANCNVRIEKATCHDEPHKRYRPSLDKRERHLHIALKVRESNLYPYFVFGAKRIQSMNHRVQIFICYTSVENYTLRLIPFEFLAPSYGCGYRFLFLKVSANFAHKKIAEAFHRDNGLRISETVALLTNLCGSLFRFVSA